MKKRETKPKTARTWGTNEVVIVPWYVNLEERIHSLRYGLHRKPSEARMWGQSWANLCNSMSAKKLAEMQGGSAGIPQLMLEAMYREDSKWIADFARGMSAELNRSRFDTDALERYEWMLLNRQRVQDCGTRVALMNLLHKIFADHDIEQKAVDRLCREIGLKY